MRNTILSLGAFTMVCLSACGSLNKQYVEADRVTYEQISPIISDWYGLKDDPGLEQAVRIKMQSWEHRIEAAENALGAE